MTAVSRRFSRLFSTNSIPAHLDNDDIVDTGQQRKTLSRVRKLSKRLSTSFKSSFSFKDEEEIDTRRKVSGSEKKKSRKLTFRRVFSLEHFNEASADMPIGELSESSAKPIAYSSLDISTSYSHEKIKRVKSLPSTNRTKFPHGRLEQYTKLEQLGEGSYATVYKGLSKESNIYVAMKEIRLQEEEGIPFTAIREASLLKELKHANIVLLHDIIPTKEHLVLIFEYMHTDLCMFLEERPFGVHPNNAKLLLFQLLRGLQFIHKKQILHRDIKPQNVLLSNRGELKLADFGLARAKSVPSRNYTHEIVTLWYRPPDVLLGSTHYTTSLDIWGVGCIFVEMISGFPLFPGVKSGRDQLNKIFKVCGTPKMSDFPINQNCTFTRNDFEDYSKQCLSHEAPRLKSITHSESLAEMMLQVIPEDRISAYDAMRHTYFDELPKAIFALPDLVSILTIKSLKFYEDHKRSEGPKSPAKGYGHYV